MSTTTGAILGHVGRFNGWMSVENEVPGPASAQATAVPIRGNFMRCTQSILNGSFILKSIATRDAPNLVLVVNDSPNAVLVYAFVGDNMNGSANGSLSVAAGSFAFFCRVDSTGDWRSAAIS
jgi:hypothetical protein